MHLRTTALLLAIAAASCASAPGAEVTTWGTLREVLREGHTEARVVLATVAGPNVIGVGALSELRGEVTVVDGRVLVAVPGGEGAVTVREATGNDAAALLVLADVPAWIEIPVGACASYEELEATIAAHLERRGDDPSLPRPVRVRGRATHLTLHVIAGACPIANPSGPSPWVFSGPVNEVELLGIYVEGAAGVLTHHTHSSHLHAVADGLMGHLDEVTLEDAVLLLPAQR